MVTSRPTWTPTTHDDYDHLKGRHVVSADAEQIGTVRAIFHPKQAMPEARGGHVFLVKASMVKSWFSSGGDLYVPESAIAAVTDDTVRLSSSKDQLAAQGWDQPPANLQDFHRA